jgi:hypothetical protein
MVNHDGQLWIERIDGRTVRAAAPMPRGEVERVVRGLNVRLGRRPDDRRPIIAEDPEADLVATAVPSDGVVAPFFRFTRIAPPRLRCWTAAGLLGGADAGRLRVLVRDGANLVVAARSELARRQIVRTLLAEAAALGQRVLHVQGHERFHTGMPGFVAVAAPEAGAVCRDGIEALAGRRASCRSMPTDRNGRPASWSGWPVWCRTVRRLASGPIWPTPSFRPRRRVLPGV